MRLTDANALQLICLAKIVWAFDLKPDAEFIDDSVEGGY